MNLRTATGIALCILSGAIDARAESGFWDFRTEVQSSIFHRDLSKQNLSTLQRTTDLFVVGSTDVQWNSGAGLRFVLGPELRALYGQTQEAPETDAARVALASADRPLGLQWSLKDAGSLSAVLSIEQAFGSYSSELFELWAGRRPVSLGVLRVFPLWNKFSRTLPISAAPNLVFSSDALSFRHQSGEWTFQSTAIAGTRAEDHVLLGLAVWYSEWAEIHALLASWWQRPVAGLAIAKDVAGATVRSEFLLISGESSEAQWGLGIEHALSAEWSWLAEGIYQSSGRASRSDYQLSLPSRFVSLQARGYGFAQVRFKPDPLWQLGLATLVNFIDVSRYLILTAQYSASESVDVFFELDFPSGASGSEFAPEGIPVAVTPVSVIRAGAPTQASVGMRAVF